MMLGQIEVNENERYECYSQLIKVNPITNKTTKKWIFVGWSPLPENLDQQEYKIKGDFVIRENNLGELERYRIIKNY